MALTPEALAQAVEVRTQELLHMAARLLLQIEGNLFRALGRGPFPPAEVPGGEGALPGPRGEEGGPQRPVDAIRPPQPHQQQQLREQIARAVDLVARLAQQAPRAAAALLVEHQAAAAAFPRATAQLIAQIGTLTDPQFAALLRALVQPGAQAGPAEVPALLTDVLGSSKNLDSLIRAARELAEGDRSGALRSSGRGQAPGLAASARAEVRNSIVSLGQTPRVGPTVASGALPGESLIALSLAEGGANVDVIRLSGADRGSDGLGTLVEVNRALAQRLGVANPLGLSGPSPQADAQATSVLSHSTEVRPVVTRAASGFADVLVELGRTSPEGFEKVASLMRSLARLSPAKFDGLLSNIESQLRQIATAPRGLPAAGPVAAAGAPGGLLGTVSVTFDADVTQRTDLLVADLRAAGLDARAVQSASVTQILINVALEREDVGGNNPLIIDLQGDGAEVEGQPGGISHR